MVSEERRSVLLGLSLYHFASPMASILCRLGRSNQAGLVTVASSLIKLLVYEGWANHVKQPNLREQPIHQPHSSKSSPRPRAQVYLHERTMSLTLHKFLGPSDVKIIPNAVKILSQTE